MMLNQFDKIIIPVRISHTFILSHPEWIFLYGQDYADKGCLGQAWAASKEPNTYPVPTMLKVCASSTDRLFMDADIVNVKRMIDEKLALVPTNKGPIIPFPKLGCGHSQMKFVAPKCYAYLQEAISKIAYPNIEIDYGGKVYPIYGNS